jgi:hypothetical protein
VNGSGDSRCDASAIASVARRDAPSPRSSVSSRPSYGGPNSGTAGGHRHTVGATIATSRGASEHRRRLTRGPSPKSS